MDAVVTSVGLRPENSLFYELLTEHNYVYIVGDAQWARGFADSNREVYAIGNLL